MFGARALKGRSYFFEKREEYIMSFTNRITEISVDEYAFLTENFELKNKNDVEMGVKYILFNRRRNIIDIVKKIFNNELTEIEKKIALDFWGDNLSVDELAEKYELSRASVYRNLNNAKKKIEKYIDYVLIYADAVKEYSVSDFLKYVQGDYIEN